MGLQPNTKTFESRAAQYFLSRALGRLTTSIARTRETKLLSPGKKSMLTCPLLVGLRINHGNPCGKAISSRALILRERKKERAFSLQSAAESWSDIALFGGPFYLLIFIILLSRISYFPQLSPT